MFLATLNGNHIAVFPNACRHSFSYIYTAYCFGWKFRKFTTIIVSRICRGFQLKVRLFFRASIILHLHTFSSQNIPCPTMHHCYSSLSCYKSTGFCVNILSLWVGFFSVDPRLTLTYCGVWNLTRTLPTPTYWSIAPALRLCSCTYSDTNYGYLMCTG